MSKKIKLHSLHFLFHILSFLADKTGGWKLFVKPKLIIGSLLLSGTAFGQNTVQTNQNQQKQTIEHKKDTPEIVEEQTFCYITETMPQFPRGDAALMKFINDNLHYPKTAIKNKTEGRVVVRFIIKPDGAIENIQVVRSVSPECDKEAIRIVKKFPKFSKPLQNGRPTSVWFTLPIQFKLDTHQKTSNIYTTVDQMPQFPGGNMELFKFIAENLKYDAPTAQCYNPVMGRVICRFVVKKDGSIDQIEVVRSLDPTLDKEAVRVIRCMPKWIPGKHKGKKINVYFTLPINFKPF